MPELFTSFFESLGLDIDDYVKLARCEPSYKVHFSPNAGQISPELPLELSTSLASLGPQLDRYEKPAGNHNALASFLAFISEAGNHYEESVKHVLLRDWNNLFAALTRWDVYPMLFRTQALKIWTTAWARACHYFKSDEVRRAMTFSSMYMGMSPFEAPATYTLLQYAEYAKGVFYPVGGFQTLVAAFDKVACKFGAEFHYNAAVKKVLTPADEPDHEAAATSRQERVHGVELEDGRRIYADAVVSNADLIWTYNNLLPPSTYAKKLQNKKQTCSSISFYWGLSEVVNELGIHNVSHTRDLQLSQLPTLRLLLYRSSWQNIIASLSMRSSRMVKCRANRRSTSMYHPASTLQLHPTVVTRWSFLSRVVRSPASMLRKAIRTKSRSNPSRHAFVNRSWTACKHA